MHWLPFFFVACYYFGIWCNCFLLLPSCDVLLCPSDMVSNCFFSFSFLNGFIKLMLARSKEKNEVLTKQVNLMPKSCKQENKSKILEGIVRSEVGKDMHHWESAFQKSADVCCILTAREATLNHTCYLWQKNGWQYVILQLNYWDSQVAQNVPCSLPHYCKKYFVWSFLSWVCMPFCSVHSEKGWLLSKANKSSCWFPFFFFCHCAKEHKEVS